MRYVLTPWVALIAVGVLSGCSVGGESEAQYNARRQRNDDKLGQRLMAACGQGHVASTPFKTDEGKYIVLCDDGTVRVIEG